MKRHPNRPNKISIDIGLAVIELHRQPGQTLSQPDIAEICECSTSAISLIEVGAIKKIRAAIKSPITEYLTD